MDQILGLKKKKYYKSKTEKDPTIEALKLELTATEAQLLNVSAELAKCKGIEEEADTTQLQLDSVGSN